MSYKVVIVADRDVSSEIEFVCSVYPGTEIWVFCGFDLEKSYSTNDHCLSCFDRMNLVGVDHDRQVVSLRAWDSRDFYMVSYDVLFVFSDVNDSKLLKKKESA